MANEKRLIDANAFKMFLEVVRQDYLEEDTFSSDFAAQVIETVQDEYLANAPTVDAVEVAHGHWTATDVIVHKAGYGVRYYYHAECKVNPHRLFGCENDYCPNCGAKMDGGN